MSGGTRRGSCLLGCASVAGEDSIEHYVACRVARSFGESNLGFLFGFSPPLSHSLLAAPICAESSTPGWRERVAVYVYAIYRVTNALRNRGRLTQEEARRALRQALVAGVEGHQRAARAVARTSWLDACIRV